MRKLRLLSGALALVVLSSTLGSSVQAAQLTEIKAAVVSAPAPQPVTGPVNAATTYSVVSLSVTPIVNINGTPTAASGPTISWPLNRYVDLGMTATATATTSYDADVSVTTPAYYTTTQQWVPPVTTTSQVLATAAYSYQQQTSPAYSYQQQTAPAYSYQQQLTPAYSYQQQTMPAYSYQQQTAPAYSYQQQTSPAWSETVIVGWQTIITGYTPTYDGSVWIDTSYPVYGGYVQPATCYDWWYGYYDCSYWVDTVTIVPGGYWQAIYHDCPVYATVPVYGTIDHPATYTTVYVPATYTTVYVPATYTTVYVPATYTTVNVPATYVTVDVPATYMTVYVPATYNTVTTTVPGYYTPVQTLNPPVTNIVRQTFTSSQPATILTSTFVAVSGAVAVAPAIGSVSAPNQLQTFQFTDSATGSNSALFDVSATLAWADGHTETRTVRTAIAITNITPLTQ